SSTDRGPAMILGIMIDFNGDGIPDKYGGQGNQAYIAYGLGDGTYTTASVRAPDLDAGIRTKAQIDRDLVDLNGDGLVDLVSTNNVSGRAVRPQYKWTVQLNPGPEGLLTRIDNELGGSTNIPYESSADAVVALNPLPAEPNSTASLAPHHHWVVKSVTVS